MTTFTRYLSIPLLCLSIHSAACSSHFTRGVHAFNDGCFVEALAQFSQQNAQFQQMDAKSRARYSLYRGLTHLALADMDAAEWWIRNAKTQYDADGTLLNEIDEGRLHSAWQSLGHEAGQWGARNSGEHASGPFQTH